MPVAADEWAGLSAALAKLPDEDRKLVERNLYGQNPLVIPNSPELEKACNDGDFVVQIHKCGAPALEQLRKPHIIRIAVVQNQIVAPTTAPIAEQYEAIEKRVEQLIDAAALGGAKVLCLQEAWTSPFFFCTRERMPWLEFAEETNVENGRSTAFIARKAKQHRMTIISPILERDALHMGVIWNTAVVVNDRGEVIGQHRKNHIPSVGDFNEATYYRNGDDGWPVFETQGVRIGVNICYGRHHPLNWQAYAFNGADIIFNPSATVGTLSEPLWSIEGRNAAIANSVFTASCNRVGSEEFPNAYTSGDGNPEHKTFGHFYGSSYIAAPDGARTPSLPRTKDGVCIAEIDVNLIRQVREKWMFQSTGRYGDYAKLFAKYVRPDFKPQVRTQSSSPSPPHGPVLLITLPRRPYPFTRVASVCSALVCTFAYLADCVCPPPSAHTPPPPQLIRDVARPPVVSSALDDEE